MGTKAVIVFFKTYFQRVGKKNKGVGKMSYDSKIG